MRNTIPSSKMDLFTDYNTMCFSGTNARKREEYKRFLYRAIQTELTARQKQMLVMYYFDSLTMPLIAEELKVNKGTVSRIIQAAIGRLTELSELYFYIHKN